MIGRSRRRARRASRRRPRSTITIHSERETPFLTAVGLGKSRLDRSRSTSTCTPGEIVGVAGLLGSGRTELGPAAVRRRPRPTPARSASQSALTTPARRRSPRSPAAIAYSTEDRKTEGIVGDLTVRENIVLALQAERGTWRPLPRRQLDDVVAQYITALQISPPNPNALIRNLSGGNQQKVLLARWLATAPRLLILDEPTRGIDVGAKAEIQKLVTELAQDGMSVVFISSELEEVLRLSQRLVVMRDREKVDELVNTDDVTTVDDPRDHRRERSGAHA